MHGVLPEEAHALNADGSFQESKKMQKLEGKDLQLGAAVAEDLVHLDLLQPSANPAVDTQPVGLTSPPPDVRTKEEGMWQDHEASKTKMKKRIGASPEPSSAASKLHHSHRVYFSVHDEPELIRQDVDDLSPLKKIRDLIHKANFSKSLLGLAATMAMRSFGMFEERQDASALVRPRDGKESKSMREEDVSKGTKQTSSDNPDELAVRSLEEVSMYDSYTSLFVSCLKLVSSNEA